MDIPEMNDWQSENRFTDIVVKVDGKEFNCHRVALASASQYFNTMLGGSFWESGAGTVTLQDINADTFGVILQYIYTGQGRITTENVFHLLKAANYLLLKPQVEKDCTSFIEKNLPFQHMFEAIGFAYTTGKTVLLYRIANYISCHLGGFSETTEFLELPFEVFKTIVDMSILEEEIVAKATIQWINHKRGDRWQYFSQLSRLGMLAGLPPTEVESIARSFIPDEISSHDMVSYLRSLKKTNMEESLTVYYKENISGNVFEITVGHTVKCDIIQEIPKCAALTKVEFDKSHNRLNFVPRYQARPYGTLKFCSHTADGEILKNVKPVELENRLYNYSAYCENLQIRGLPDIKRIYIFLAWEGIMWEYDCAGDMCHRIKAVNKENAMPTTATCQTSNRVYHVFDKEECGPYHIHVYDGCARKWTVLPISNYTSTSPRSPAVCALRGKLYIYNRHYSMYEIYDPSTEEWRVSKPNPYISRAPFEVVPYGDELWLFSSSTKPFEGDEKTAYIVHIYKPESNSWRKYPLIRAAIKKCGSITDHSLNFFDAVVF